MASQNALTCSHRWIDPNDPPIQRAPYSPLVGPGRREMKAGHVYRCNNCGAVLNVSKPAAGGTP